MPPYTCSLNLENSPNWKVHVHVHVLIHVHVHTVREITSNGDTILTVIIPCNGLGSDVCIVLVYLALLIHYGCGHDAAIPPGVVDYLGTEVATSKQKKFAFVTFIDTPGLVDGDMKYPFDVEKALIWLGDMADRIFVFFDPLGQALCRRTLDIVGEDYYYRHAGTLVWVQWYRYIGAYNPYTTPIESLNESRPERIKFYLSKADTVSSQSDRQRVLMQITQELCKRKGLNRAGFDMPTIFIPTLTGKVK